MEYIIKSLNLKGDGRSEDGAVFARVLPGETVSIDDIGKLRVEHPSTDRVSPPCRHFKSCGGCALMHASDAFVADWKTALVQNALKNQGLDTKFKDIVTSPKKSRRRAKFSGTRTKKGALVGFHGRASHTITPVIDCQLVLPEVLEAMPALEELTILAASRKSEVQFTVIHTSNGLDVQVATEKELNGALRIQLANLAQTHRFARLSWNDDTIVELLPPLQQFGAAHVKVPPGAFLQATAEGESELVSSVQDIVGESKKIIDFFAGCGTFSLPLAEKAEVHAVEGESNMLAELDAGWRGATGLKKVTTETRDLFRRPLEQDELARFDAAVLDPPRAGALAQIQRLTSTKTPKIAMVSCNPVTFARDAKLLVDGGYRFDWVKPVDQFRWSAHVELVGAFSLD